MKICAISDIHGYLPDDIEPCDVVCICGDIMPLNIQRDFAESISWLAGPFQAWALNLPCKKVIMIWGNHDFIGERLYRFGNTEPSSGKTWRIGFTGYEQSCFLFKSDDIFNPKIRILCDDMLTYQVDNDSIRFYGTSWCPELSNWAFYANDENLVDNFSRIPDDVDVLLTHCPPKFAQQGVVLDKNNWNFGKDFGCEELQKKLTEFTLRDLHVLSGHIHSGCHQTETFGNIKYTNVSLKDENYKATYKPFYFEINLNR